MGSLQILSCDGSWMSGLMKRENGKRIKCVNTCWRGGLRGRGRDRGLAFSCYLGMCKLGIRNVGMI